MVFIGKLEAPAATSVNNHTTATPFDIPDEAKQLYLESDTDGVLFEIGVGTGNNYDTFATTVARGAPLYDSKDPYVVEGAFDVPKLGRSPMNAAPLWLTLHVYVVGDKVTAHGWTWLCTGAGTSGGGTGPAYGSEADGTVVWRPLERAPDAGSTPNKTRARIAIFNEAGLPVVVRVWVA